MDTDTSLIAINTVFANFHDWFEDLNEELGFKSQLTLEKIALKLWIENNFDSIKKFITLLEIINTKNKSHLKKEGDNYFISVNEVDFSVCEESKQTYNLNNFIGNLLTFSLFYSEDEIKCKINI